MNLNQLKYFAAVAEHRSFTKAAAQYYLTQTAITQQIRSLEEAVGAELIDRSKRPVSLTPAGAVFLKDAKAVIERMDTAFRKAKEASAGLVGSVRIGYVKGYERSNLSDKLCSFHRSYPNILLTCFRDDTDALAAALYSSHPYAQRPFLRREELKNETILYMSPSGNRNSFGDAYFMQLYQNAGYQPDILLESADAESILMMVAAEEGISILPSYTTDKLINADNLIFVPLAGEQEVENIHAIWKKENISQALSQFLRQL